MARYDDEAALIFRADVFQLNRTIAYVHVLPLPGGANAVSHTNCMTLYHTAELQGGASTGIGKSPKTLLQRTDDRLGPVPSTVESKIGFVDRQMDQRSVWKRCISACELSN